MAESKFSDIINASLQKIKEFASSDTIFGEPLTVGSTTIVPVSRVTMGFASGGVDYAGKKQREAATHPNNFGGGGGTGVNIVPIAFLVISENGGVEVLPITGSSDSSSIDKIAALIDRSPEILSRLLYVFKNKKPAEADEIAVEDTGAEE